MALSRGFCGHNARAGPARRAGFDCALGGPPTGELTGQKVKRKEYAMIEINLEVQKTQLFGGTSTHFAVKKC